MVQLLHVIKTVLNYATEVTVSADVATGVLDSIETILQSLSNHQSQLPYQYLRGA
jgi:hypothetical protein